MLKVIIVDDEQFIAQGLQALIDWNPQAMKWLPFCLTDRRLWST